MFQADTSPNKRAALIDSLFTRDEFADYWAMKWCDVLRVNDRQVSLRDGILQTAMEAASPPD